MGEAMRLRICLFLFCSSLSACTDKVAEAERRLELVKKSNGSADDICNAAREVERAYVEDKDRAADYPLKKVEACIACNSAAIDKLSPYTGG